MAFRLCNDTVNIIYLKKIVLTISSLKIHAFYLNDDGILIYFFMNWSFVLHNNMYSFNLPEIYL